MRLNLSKKPLLLALSVLLVGTSFAANAPKPKQEAQAQTVTTPSSVAAQPMAAPASAFQPQSGEQIKWQVISGGGVRGTSASFVLSGTVGQTAVGAGSSASYKINQGFWQNFTATSCMCGDANGDATFNISDAVFLIQYIFAGGAAPNPLCHGDANGDSTINISDAVFLIQYIFAGGAAPHCP